MLGSDHLSLSPFSDDFRGYVFLILMSFCVIIDRWNEIGYWFLSSAVFAILFYILYMSKFKFLRTN